VIIANFIFGDWLVVTKRKQHDVGPILALLDFHTLHINFILSLF